MDFTILAVVLLIGVGIPVRNKLIRKYREEKKKQDGIMWMTSSRDWNSSLKLH